MIHWLTHKLGLSRCPECETLVEFAMDGLPEGQQERVRRHLADCPPCREQVRDFWQVKEGLGLCSKQLDAPADVSARVLARLREEGGTGAGPSAGAATAPAEDALRRRGHLGGWPRFWMTLGPVFAGLSLVMTLVALGTLLSRPAAAPAPASPAAGTQAAAAGDNDLSAIANALMNDPHAARVSLGAAGPAPEASGLLVLCRGQDHAYFHGDHLSRCPLGRNYVLWMKPSGGEPRRLARFAVEKDGSSVHLLQLDGGFNASGPVDFMVTQDGGGGPDTTWLKGSVRL